MITVTFCHNYFTSVFVSVSCSKGATQFTCVQLAIIKAYFGIFIHLFNLLSLRGWLLKMSALIKVHFSLFIYFQHEFHRGSRSTRSLVSYILDSLEVNLYHLSEGKNTFQYQFTPSPYPHHLLNQICGLSEIMERLIKTEIHYYSS